MANTLDPALGAVGSVAPGHVAGLALENAEHRRHVDRPAVVACFHRVEVLGVGRAVSFGQRMKDSEGGELAEVQEVALVPGTAFGSPGHIRLSFATDMQSLEKALSRINDAIS